MKYLVTGADGKLAGRVATVSYTHLIEHLDENTIRFTADVYDASELIPWIRTFICRITEIHISNEKLEEKFRDDMNAMYALYGLEDGDEHDIQ